MLWMQHFVMIVVGRKCSTMYVLTFLLMVQIKQMIICKYMPSYLTFAFGNSIKISIFDPSFMLLCTTGQAV